MPRSSAATVAISPVSAGMPPVSPAATTRSGGGRRRHRAAWRSSRRLRRSAGSRAPSSARMPGQCRGRTSRNLLTICQCSASSSGTRSPSRSKLAPSPATLSRSRARLAASAAAWPGSSGSRPGCAPQRMTSCASSSRRRNSGIAGGTPKPSPPAVSPTGSSSPESRSPTGCIRGSSSAEPGSLPSTATRRNASRNARTARRVGSNTVTRGRRSGSPPVSRSNPSASTARNGRPRAIVNRLRRTGGSLKFMLCSSISPSARQALLFIGPSRPPGLSAAASYVRGRTAHRPFCQAMRSKTLWCRAVSLGRILVTQSP